jgi:hypothetical protein
MAVEGCPRPERSSDRELRINTQSVLDRGVLEVQDGGVLAEIGNL